MLRPRWRTEAFKEGLPFSLHERSHRMLAERGEITTTGHRTPSAPIETPAARNRLPVAWSHVSFAGNRSPVAWRKAPVTMILLFTLAVGGVVAVGTTGCSGTPASEQGASQQVKTQEEGSESAGNSSGESSGDQASKTSATSDAEATASITIPDVAGQQESDAVAALEDAGLTAKVQWQESSKIYHTVLSTDPPAGTSVHAGDPVNVYIASPGARSELYLADYLLCSRSSIEQYLTWKGWTKTLDGGVWMEWEKPGVGTLEFGHDLPQIDDVPNEPPADSFNFVGYTPESLAGSLAGATTSLDYLRSAEQACGFADPLAHYDVGEEPANFSDGSPSVSELGAASGSAYWFVMAEQSRYDGTMRVVLQVAGKDLMGSDPQTALANFYINLHVG